MNKHAYRDCRDLIVKEYQAIYGAQSWYNLLDKHPFGLDAVKEALVIDKEYDGDKYLCAYIVSDRELAVGILRE